MKLIKILLVISLVCCIPLFPLFGYGLIITISQAKWIAAAKCVIVLVALFLASFIAIANILDFK